MSDFPPVHDEASPTPRWVPIVGAAILVLTCFSAFLRSVSVREMFTAPAAVEAPGAASGGTAPSEHAPSVVVAPSAPAAH